MTSKDEKVPENHEKPETWRLYKNVIVLSFAFMIQFTSYYGAADLQSSINPEEGLGTASLAAVYAGLIFSNIFLSTAVIKYLGLKWTIGVSLISYLPYIIFQLWPSFYTLIPSAFVLGLGAGPLWCAVSTYVSVVAEIYSKSSKISTEALVQRFFGLFFTFYSLGVIWGNLISSLVLRSGDNKAAVTKINASLIPEICGVNFLPSSDSSKVLQQQPSDKIQMIIGIYIACIVAAVIILAFGVDSLKKYNAEEANSCTGQSGLALLAVTVKLLAEPDQLLLIIISMFIGIQDVFFTAGLTAAYVSCSIGTGTVGFVMMAHGLTDVIASAVIGLVSKIVKRIVLLSCASGIILVLSIFLLVWKPQANSDVILYIVALLWGLCSTTFLVLVNAYHGLLFPDRKEAAFSNFRIWKSIGYVIAYVTSHHMRTRDKIYLVLAALIVGNICYYITEYRGRTKKKPEKEKEEVTGVVNLGFKYLD